MIDLTPYFQTAIKTVVGWGFEKAEALAFQFSDIVPDGSISGGRNENWIWVYDGDEVIALAYQLAPLIITKTALVEKAGAIFQGVVIIPGLPDDYNAPAFCMDKRQAAGLLPYPPDELELDWGGFSASDFVFEIGM